MDRREIVCIICPTGCRIHAEIGESGAIDTLEGHQCKRGETYVRSEVLDPVRVLTSIVRFKGRSQRMCPIRSDRPVPKGIIREMARAVSKIEIEGPVRLGDVIVKNIMGTGADIIATQSID